MKRSCKGIYDFLGLVVAGVFCLPFVGFLALLLFILSKDEAEENSEDAANCRQELLEIAQGQNSDSEYRTTNAATTPLSLLRLRLWMVLVQIV